MTWRSVVCGMWLLLGMASAWSAERPNVLIILADDLGFSDIGCYGGEIATPNLDRLAANGVRFTQFYNTARCWPTRSVLLSGYYAQQIRMDPNKGRMPNWARLLPHALKPAGYRSYHAGKWHVTGLPKPVADGGFDRSYWFQDWDRYFSPKQHFGDDQLLPPVSAEAGYYATTAFAEQMIGFLRDHQTHHAEQPFFGYLAFIAPHFPLHALPEDIAKYEGLYREGWDVIRQRRHQRLKELGIVDCALPPLETTFLPRYWKEEFRGKLGAGEAEHPLPWSQLTAEQQQFQAAKMAIHAAMVDRMDREIGRVLDQLRAMNALDNTLVCFLSDNGADASILVRGEGHDRSVPLGSANSFLCLGPGWATASNTPFRRHKIWNHEGGISTPMIVHWPSGLKAKGELRRTPAHIIDVWPTVLDLAGIPLPLAQSGIGPNRPGLSLIRTLWHDTPVPRDYLFFQHEGNRALRMGDWKVVSAREDGDRWELFNLATDRSELHDLSTDQPDRLRTMAERWTALEKEMRQQAERE